QPILCSFGGPGGVPVLQVSDNRRPPPPSGRTSSLRRRWNQGAAVGWEQRRGNPFPFFPRESSQHTLAPTNRWEVRRGAATTSANLFLDGGSVGRRLSSIRRILGDH
ncbi:unnamed protein product, partial [Musa textilis]